MGCLRDICGDFQTPRADETGQCHPRRLKLSCDLPLLYTNEAQSCTDTCPEGTVGDPITVTIGAGEISSPFSTADANDLATVEACRQAAALRALTPCQYPNTEQTCEDVCPEGTTGETISVTIDAGEFTGDTQEEADALAMAEACAQVAALREANPCEEEEPEFSVSASFESVRLAGELCGIDEYTDPSVPPKRYRTQTLGGAGWCNNDYRDGPSGVPNQCDNLITTLVNGGRAYYEGSYTFDQATCAELNDQRYYEGNGHPCHLAIPLLQPGILPILFTPLGCSGPYEVDSEWVGTIDIDLQKTFVEWFWNGTCFVLTDLDGFGFPLYTGRVVTGTVTKELTDEDTEADAFARAVPENGTSNIAKLKVRGAGDFEVEEVTVSVSIDAIGLTSGLAYEVILPLVIEDYAGGNPVSSQINYPFTASGPTENITDFITADAGKRVTIGTPTIDLA